MTHTDTPHPTLPFTLERPLPYLHNAEQPMVQHGVMAYVKGVYRFIALYCDQK